MTFGQSIATVFKKYADFKGTASRSEYWWWALFTFLVSLPFQFIDKVANNVTDPAVALAILGLALLYLGWALAILVPSLAVAVRRLRDAGYHWAWLFIVLVPIVGAIVLIVFLASPSRQGVAPQYQAVQPAQPSQTPPNPPTTPTA